VYSGGKNSERSTVTGLPAGTPLACQHTSAIFPYGQQEKKEQQL